MAIAIVGRPNVGKSALFNHLVGQNRSLVWNRAGVTQDRIVGSWELVEGQAVELWDLAGLGSAGLPNEWMNQIELFLLVIDASEEPAEEDYKVLQFVRESQKPWILVLNKQDKKTFQGSSHLMVRTARKQPIAELSAETQEGFDQLVETLQSMKTLKTFKAKTADHDVLILGRPNSGKSSLLNRIVGTRLSKVSETAGTTKDIVEGFRKLGSKTWRFRDTAGIRKKAKIYHHQDPIEIFSVKRTLSELEDAELCIFLVDPSESAQLSTQEKKIMQMIRKQAVPCIVAVNKWDQMRKTWSEKSFYQSLLAQLREFEFFPIVFMSAKTGFQVKKLLSELEKVESKRQRLSTAHLNRWLQEVQAKHVPPLAKKAPKAAGSQALKYYYMTQYQTRPMSFQIFCNRPQQIPQDEKKRLENDFREHFSLEGIPIVFRFRRKPGGKGLSQRASRR